MAAGSLTETVEGDRGSVFSVTLAWTSHATGGNVEQTATNLRGVLKRISFVPGGTTPTDQYDVTLEDADGIDVLGGLGENLSNSTATTVSILDSLPLAQVLLGNHTLKVTNAGNAKTGSLVAYLTAQ